VLHGLVRGQAPKMTARMLGISPQTVRNHMKSVYTKLGVSSRAELFAAFIASFAPSGRNP
jgi:DNA-binding CsgD family transcriptional regulator